MWKDNKLRGNFGQTQTFLVKGVAIICLLMTHLFNGEQKQNYYRALLNIQTVNGENPLISIIAAQGRVCVAMFLILSGLGLCHAYVKWEIRQSDSHTLKEKVLGDVRFVFYRLKKLYFSYWLIFIVCAVYGNITRLRTFFKVYENFGDLICDLLGISYLVHGYKNTYNVTWWFMSIILIYYILFPILFKWIKKLPLISMFILFIISVLTNIPQLEELFVYSFSFAVGIFFYHTHILDIAMALREKKNMKLIVLLLFLSTMYLKIKIGIKADAVFAIAIILLTIVFLEKIPVMDKILYKLGVVSSYIFYFHTFLYAYWYKNLVYKPLYPTLITVLFLLVCYVNGMCFLKYESAIKKYKWALVSYTIFILGFWGLTVVFYREIENYNRDIQEYEEAIHMEITDLRAENDNGKVKVF